MEYVNLGSTGIKVSRLCFGGLVIGPLQVGLSPEAGAEIILKSMELGVNFIDTAELYNTFPHIKLALEKSKSKPVISTKSYAYSREAAAKSLEKARREMNLDIIDIFLLHEQTSRLTLRGHREALEFYLTAKQKGLIKAVGVSTHNCEVVEACSEMPEIDVIHPLINKTGVGIGDGTVYRMLSAIKQAYGCGKGIFSMKPLGGGNLLGSFYESMRFVLDIPYIHSIAVGMQSVDEVEANVSIFNGCEISEQAMTKIGSIKKKLHIDYWCERCGKCVERCAQGALELADSKISVKHENCILCGYCSTVCPAFAIKVW